MVRKTYLDLLLSVLTRLHHHLLPINELLLLAILHHLLLHLAIHINHIWVLLLLHHLLLLHLCGFLLSHHLLLATHVNLVWSWSSFGLTTVHWLLLFLLIFLLPFSWSFLLNRLLIICSLLLLLLISRLLLVVTHSVSCFILNFFLFMKTQIS